MINVQPLCSWNGKINLNSSSLLTLGKQIQEGDKQTQTWEAGLRADTQGAPTFHISLLQIISRNFPANMATLVHR